MIKCLICGFECKGLTLHLHYKHKIKPKDYQQLFPESDIFSNETKKKMSENNHLVGTHISFQDRIGEEKAKAAYAASGKSRVGKKRREQGETLKKTWDSKKEEWSAGIKNAWTDERRIDLSHQMKSRLEKFGYHLAFGRETAFEKFVRETLEFANFEVITQHGTKKSTLGTVRFFDIYVAELNLLIECDGEYWHERADRIEIDVQKDMAAEIEEYKLLRLSDREFSRVPNSQDAEKLLSLLSLSNEDLKERSRKLIQRRKEKIERGYPANKEAARDR